MAISSSPSERTSTTPVRMVSLWLKATSSVSLDVCCGGSRRVLPAARRCVCVGNLFIYYEKVTLKPSSLLMSSSSLVPRNTVARRICCGTNPKRPILSWRLRLDGPAARIRGQNVDLCISRRAGVCPYDPTSDYLRPPLRGLSLVGDNYELMPTTALPDGTLTLYSNVLGLELRLVQGVLRFVDQPPVSDSCRTAKLSRHGRRPRNAPGAEAAARAEAEARLAAVEAQLRALREQGEGL